MNIQIYHLSKDQKRIGIKELDLTRYIKIGTTGTGLAFKPKRGKVIEAYFENIFYDWYLREQEYLNENAGRTYHYDLIDKNLPDKPSNRKRDEKGRPIKIYTQWEDLYKKYNVAKWWFVEDNTFDTVRKFIKDNNMIFYDYINNEWIED